MDWIIWPLVNLVITIFPLTTVTKAVTPRPAIERPAPQAQAEPKPVTVPQEEVVEP